MINLKIDNIDVAVPEGTTILKAAEHIGVKIPSMCFNEQVENHASCMVCMVKNADSNELMPACEAKVQEGMNIISDNPDVVEARKEALELLLSDHVGDCEAPCRTSCPLFMNIPEMNRLIADRNYVEALKVVKEEIALPIILGYLCHAPCEKACRRKEADNTISICKLKRFVAEEDLKNSSLYLPKQEEEKDKRIAIIGAGLSGLSCAYHLLKKGYKCSIYDKNQEIGGLLLEVQGKELPKSAIKNEIEILKEYGAEFKLDFFIDDKLLQDQLTKEFDAVVLATGDNSVNNNSFKNNQTKVFKCGCLIKNISKAVMAVANGKETAFKVHAFLMEREARNEIMPFNSKFGKLRGSEIEEYLMEAKNKGGNILENISEIIPEDAISEAERCMRCDCRKPHRCKLRIYANEYNAKQKTFKFNERKIIRKYFKENIAVYEPEKCIKCGLCIKITEKYKEEIGLTYIGRGFHISIAIPFNKSLNNAMNKAVDECVKICPTGALAEFYGEQK